MADANVVLRKRFFTREEAATYTGYAKTYLDKLATVGGGPHFLKRGRRVFYPIEELDAWMTSISLIANTSDQCN